MNYNSLHFYCVVDRRATKAREQLDAYIEEMRDLYPIRVTIEEFDGDTIEWVERRKRYYATDSFVFEYTKRIHREHGTDVDAVMFFVDRKNFKQGKVRLRGFKLGRIFNGYHVAFTRYRRGYEQTAEHESLHFIDEYVKENTGIKLERVLNVDDFDDDVVHSQLYWRDLKYKYDEVWANIGSYISNAVFQRRKGTLVFQLNQIKVALTELLKVARLMKWKSHSVPEIEFEKMHTTKQYELREAKAVICHIDLGTEAGTIDTILNGPRSVSYHWYIPRHAKYVIEFVPKGRGAWHAGVVHEPQKDLGIILGGANQVVESGEPNRYSYGICFEGRTTSTEPTKAQVELASELLSLKKIDHLPLIAHWQVTSYKPRIVSKYVQALASLSNKT